MLQHSASLGERDPGEPVDEILKLGTVFEVLEQGGNRHPGSTEDPGAADPCWIAFNSGTGGPVDHRVRLARRLTPGKYDARGRAR